MNYYIMDVRNIWKNSSFKEWNDFQDRVRALLERAKARDITFIEHMKAFSFAIDLLVEMGFVCALLQLGKEWGGVSIYPNR